MDRVVTVTAIEPFLYGTREVRRGQSVKVKASEALALARRRKISLTRGVVHTSELTATPTPEPETPRRRRGRPRRVLVADE